MSNIMSKNRIHQTSMYYTANSDIIAKTRQPFTINNKDKLYIYIYI